MDQGIKYEGKSSTKLRYIICLGALLLAAVAALSVALAVIVSQQQNAPMQKQQDADKGKMDATKKPAPKACPPKGKNGYCKCADPNAMRSTTSNKFVGRYACAAVASDHKVCSKIGTDIMLKHNGSSVDAAIATTLCIGVVLPNAIGVGGGAFWNIYAKQRGSKMPEHRILIAREVAPIKAKQDMYVADSSKAVYGGLAAGVPGEIKGMYEAWKQYGRLPWKQVLAEPIRLAKEGVEIGGWVSKGLKNRDSTLREKNDWRKTLLEMFLVDPTNPAGPLKKRGEKFRNPKLARTLEIVAEKGADAFYDGELSGDIEKDIADGGGIITREDLRKYNTVWKRPVIADLDSLGLRMYGVPPPSSGVVIGYILKILEGYKFSGGDLSDINKRIRTYHRFVEALKFGYGQRSQLGDEDYVDIKNIVNKMLSSKFAEETRKNISDDSIRGNYTQYNPKFYTPQDGGTAQISVYGPDGSAVGVTSSVNYFFGGLLMGSRTGIIFNNQMDDFSTPNVTNTWGFHPSPSNFITPGKRPMSSMSPTIIKDRSGNIRLITGGSGGSRIITAICMVAFRTLMLNMPLQEAMNATRLHHILLPEDLHYETTIEKELLDGLKAKGHKTTPKTFIKDNLGSLESILNHCPKCDNISKEEDEINCRKSCLEAVGDERKERDPQPDGY